MWDDQRVQNVAATTTAPCSLEQGPYLTAESIVCIFADKATFQLLSVKREEKGIFTIMIKTPEL